MVRHSVSDESGRVESHEHQPGVARSQFRERQSTDWRCLAFFTSLSSVLRLSFARSHARSCRSFAKRSRLQVRDSLFAFVRKVLVKYGRLGTVVFAFLPHLAGGCHRFAETPRE